MESSPPNRMAFLAAEAGLFLVRASPRAYPLPDAAVRERVAAALGTGAQTADALRQRWPAATAEQVVQELGFAVRVEASSSRGTGVSRLRLAGFASGRGISLYRDGLAALDEVLRELTSPEEAGAMDVRELLVAHELFHGLGRVNRRRLAALPELPDLAVARRFGYPARLLGIPFRAAIFELEEVAAHGFSTAWTRLPVPALLLHACLSARYDASWAAWCAEHEICRGLRPNGG